MIFSPFEIEQTRRMFDDYHLDVRTITLGISLFDCIRGSLSLTTDCIYDKICQRAEQLLPTAQSITEEYGIPIINTRISLTPLALIAASSAEKTYTAFARTMEKAAETVGIDFIGGFSALVHKGTTKADSILMHSIPEALAETKKVCASVSLAESRSGINADAVHSLAKIILKTARQAGDLGCARIVGFANPPEDNPFMAGAFHGIGEADTVLHVGVSGPGAVCATIKDCPSDLPLHELAEEIKKTSFRITRIGQLVASVAAKRLGVQQGIVDLSLAPTPAVGDSVARILEAMGLERVGTHGSTAALALLNTAVKTGGLMASSHVGGLSGSFLPVSEDEGMASAVADGHLSLDKLEAMTAVCSVGLDMVALPGDCSSHLIAAIIMDEMALGIMNNKTTAVRLIPAIGKKEGDWLSLGGLLGSAPIITPHRASPKIFVERGGRILPPVHSFRN